MQTHADMHILRYSIIKVGNLCYCDAKFSFQKGGY